MPRSSSATNPHDDVFLTIVFQSHLGQPRVETAIGSLPSDLDARMAGAAAVGVHALGHSPHDDRLEVAHEVAPDERMFDAGEKEEPRRLDRTRGQHHVSGSLGPHRSVWTDVLDTGRPAVADVDL